MIRLFRHYISVPILLLGVLEAGLIFISGELAWRLRWYQIGEQPGPVSERLIELLAFLAISWLSFFAVGYYQSNCYRSRRLSTTRLLVGLGFSILALSILFFLFPDVAIWRSVFFLSTILVFITLFSARTIFITFIGEKFKRRILVLGAGKRAVRISDIAKKPQSDFLVVAYVQMSENEVSVPEAIPRNEITSLIAHAEELRIDDIVLALDERRGSLPVESLLEAKLHGHNVIELSSFLEQQTGRVDIDSLNPSWLIFSDGFWASQDFSVLAKRVLDISASLLMLILTAPILCVTALLIKLTSPGPIFYRQERLGQYSKPFKVLKFRSMRMDAEKDGTPQWAQQGDTRVTAIGRFIRSARIDEIPQILNILKGDMSFVGPRPERPFFVEQLAKQIPYFNERHVVKPGLTGWAQLNYPYGASLEDARHKLEYDLYYVKNYSLFLDLLIIIQTVRVILWQDGVR